MASRTISTRLVIEGESQYKQSVANINSALSALKAQLTAVKAEYENNANSMEALRAKGTLLNQIQEQQWAKVAEVQLALENARAAQQGYAEQVEVCRARVVTAQAALSALKSSADSTAEAEEKLPHPSPMHRRSWPVRSGTTRLPSVE